MKALRIFIATLMIFAIVTPKVVRAADSKLNDEQMIALGIVAFLNLTESVSDCSSSESISIAKGAVGVQICPDSIAYASESGRKFIGVRITRKSLTATRGVFSVELASYESEKGNSSSRRDVSGTIILNVGGEKIELTCSPDSREFKELMALSLVPLIYALTSN